MFKASFLVITLAFITQPTLTKTRTSVKFDKESYTINRSFDSGLTYKATYNPKTEHFIIKESHDFGKTYVTEHDSKEYEEKLTAFYSYLHKNEASSNFLKNRHASFASTSYPVQLLATLFNFGFPMSGNQLAVTFTGFIYFLYLTSQRIFSSYTPLEHFEEPILNQPSQLIDKNIKPQPIHPLAPYTDAAIAIFQIALLLSAQEKKPLAALSPQLLLLIGAALKRNKANNINQSLAKIYSLTAEYKLPIEGRDLLNYRFAYSDPSDTDLIKRQIKQLAINRSLELLHFYGFAKNGEILSVEELMSFC